MTDDIVTFIRARLEEDQDADWHARTCQTHQTMPPGTPFGLAGSPLSCNCGVPDLVEADVEVKRRMLAYCEWVIETRVLQDAANQTTEWTQARDSTGQHLSKLLASEWSTHPAYRSEWTP